MAIPADETAGDADPTTQDTLRTSGEPHVNGQASAGHVSECPRCRSRRLLVCDLPGPVNLVRCIICGNQWTVEPGDGH